MRSLNALILPASSFVHFLTGNIGNDILMDGIHFLLSHPSTRAELDHLFHFVRSMPCLMVLVEPVLGMLVLINPISYWYEL